MHAFGLGRVGYNFRLAPLADSWARQDEGPASAMSDEGLEKEGKTSCPLEDALILWKQ